MDLLDSTITTIAAPTISSSFHGGPGLIKWLGASYEPSRCCRATPSPPARTEPGRYDWPLRCCIRYRRAQLIPRCSRIARTVQSLHDGKRSR